MSRQRLVQDAFDLVVRTMDLRPPQAEALRELKDALLRLPVRLSECPTETAVQFLQFRSGWRHLHHPAFTLALATGVGKTRLAGAIIAFLWLSQEARTFLVLAPRRAVLRRFESALNPRFREYLFVDQGLVPEPHVIRADEIDTPNGTEYGSGFFSTGPQIYLLSPQLISTSERFTRRPDFSDRSPADLLRAQKDLVVIVDEAHHVGKITDTESTVWARTIRDLKPCLQLGLTATPRQEEGVNVLYEYPLNKALMEGHYTKKVQILVRRFGEEWSSENDIDHATIDFTLQRLAAKDEAVAQRPDESGFPAVKPVAVLFCKDIDHAQAVYDWIIATERMSATEILLTHSKMSKSEDEIDRLLSIESSENPVRLVINVLELTEGWDVTNVYVVSPLRAMATFAGALQSMGRGLRLPAGRRVNDAELDTLDVVCFGKEALARIIEQATEWVGQVPSALSDLTVTDHDSPRVRTVSIAVHATRPVTISPRRVQIRHEEVNLTINVAALDRVSRAIVEGLELAAARTRVLGVSGQPRLARDRFILAAASRVVQLMPRELADKDHLGPVSRIITDWLDDKRHGEEWIDVDPMEMAEELAAVLRSEITSRAAQYDVLPITEEVRLGDFLVSVDLSADLAESYSVADFPIFNLSGNFERDVPYRGWSMSVHEAYTFDSRHEALVARLLDQAGSISWWARNEPRRLRIPTPLGFYSPDFIYEEQTTDGPALGILEVKGDLYWEAVDGDSRLKAAAGREWCAVQSRVMSRKWQFRTALESDIEACQSWVALEQRLVL